MIQMGIRRLKMVVKLAENKNETAGSMMKMELHRMQMVTRRWQKVFRRKQKVFHRKLMESHMMGREQSRCLMMKMEKSM